MAVGCCFGKSDPNIWTPQMVGATWSCEPHSRIHKKNTKNPSTVKCHFDSKYFCPVFFFSSPAPPNTWNHQSEERSEPSDRTTSPGTGGRPRNSWRNHGNHGNRAVEMGVGFLGPISVDFLLVKMWVKKHHHLLKVGSDFGVPNWPNYRDTKSVQ